MSFTSTDVMNEVKKIAAADPEHVYVGDQDYNCTYTQQELTEPCIVGRALMALGVSEATLEEECEGFNASAVCEELCATYWPNDLTWLNIVQKQQDNGHTWGASVAFANREMEGVYA